MSKAENLTEESQVTTLLNPHPMSPSSNLPPPLESRASENSEINIPKSPTLADSPPDLSAEPTALLLSPIPNNSALQNLLGPLPAESLHEYQNSSTSRLEDVTYGSIRLLAPWFPNVDPNHPRAKTWRTWKSRREIVLRTNLGIVCIIGCINFILAVIGFAKFEITDGVATLYQGNCDYVKWTDTGLHALINILSTVLLGASNLTLQLVASPTRKEINAAHKRGIWLDLGIPSVGNLKWISKTNVVIWCLLASTSLPIHFLYNATVFSALSTNNYGWITVTDSFFTSPNWISVTNDTLNRYQEGQQGYEWVPTGQGSGDFVTYIYNNYHANSTLYQNYTPSECVRAYNNPFVWRPNLVMYSLDNNTGFWGHSKLNGSILAGDVGTGDGMFINLCTFAGTNCTEMEEPGSNISHPFYFPQGSPQQRSNLIGYCLNRAGEPGEANMGTCHLQFSPQLLIIVAAFNFVKFICILWVTVINKEDSICTIGDAVASFLEEPDLYTKDLGIASEADIVRSGTLWNSTKGEAIPWKPRRNRFWRAASRSRWLFVMISSLMILIIGVILMGVGLWTEVKWNRSIRISTLLADGFGAVNSNQLLNFGQATAGQTGLFVNIILGNIIQVVVSLLYIAHNSLLTCLLVAEEWSGFGRERKTLRVSSPKGIQRSTYFISVPLRYGIPMMAFTSLEHWLLSQCIFTTRVIQYDWNGKYFAGWTNTGYSLLPCIPAIILPFLFLAAQVLHGFLRHFPKDNVMPLAATCSAAISSACHRPEQDKNAHLLPVQWGIAEKDDSGLERCSFTTHRDVKPPLQYHEYLTMPMVTRENSKERQKQWWKLRRRKQVNGGSNAEEGALLPLTVLKKT